MGKKNKTNNKQNKILEEERAAAHEDVCAGCLPAALCASWKPQQPHARTKKGETSLREQRLDANGKLSSWESQTQHLFI